MRVVHIASSLRGGAGVAARRLSDALNAAGTTSALVCRSGSPDAPDAIAVDITDDAAQQVAWLFEEAVQVGYIAPNRSPASNTLFTLDYAGIPLAEHDAIRQADVINLHWTSFFQSPETLTQLFALGRPIVWTLHDMSPFTGGCHYSAGCERFISDCGQCPQLSGDPARAAERRLADKIKSYAVAHDIAVVSPSAWLGNEARRSRAFAGARVETIANSVDATVFNPALRAAARRNLGVPGEAVCVGFAPLDRSERRKGFAELEAALALVAPQTAGADIRLVALGEATETAAPALPFINLGALERESDVAAALSACDICVTPSLEDNLPNTILEAMACGTPVVAFDVGGAKDAIVHGETGALVEAGDVKALAAQISTLAARPDQRRAMGKAARARAEALFAPRLQAEAYRALYESLAKRAHTRPVRHRAPSRLSETMPAGVLAAAWPSFVARTAHEHQAALDQIERNRHWAEKTEEILLTARERAAGHKDWAKRSEASLAETRALLEKTRQWAIGSDEALAQQRARADEMQAWARKSEALATKHAAIADDMRAWAEKSEAALAEKANLAEEMRAWAERSEIALAEKTKLADEMRAWAVKSDAALAQKAKLAEEMRAWAEKSEAALAERAKLLEGMRAWAEKSEAALAQQKAHAENLERRLRETDSALAAKQQLAEDMRAWAQRSEASLAQQRARADEMEQRARVNEAVLLERTALLQQTQAWAERAETALAQQTSLNAELRSWAEGAEARAAEIKRAHAELETALAEAETLIERISWKRRLRRWRRALGLSGQADTG